MRLNSKGQVTIPVEIREKYGLHPGDEVDVVEVGNTLQIIRRESSATRGGRAAHRLRGTATTRMTTDEIMGLLRDQ
ncbi:AbrB/MazE/SpoVT family DNA-binding domain-containing protein [Microbispora sp. ATCC PTA-5024]|uniref:AbrB/MazE/SpoVT family DNA-binding domain-containing protein n=1 Tax=Microbispora sp. ATCC PTA-5024 TaxID=316330 RepID=UPI0003DDE57A|nr:AbrB/MazE/SpoVT family DNA-binding domain-containing protein [Microbispora sp. ATCC PTA-5024]ETK33011.1 AbrB family transcriptional regulator [Microbispora sp. ATCC PTA-5024]